MIQQKLDKKVIVLKLVGGGIALWGSLALVGLLIKHVLVYNSIGAWDRSVEVWFVAHRHSSLNTLTSYANDLGSTRYVIGIVIVIFLLFRWRLGRWYESWVILTVMVGEVTVFVAVTLTVHRLRPDIIRLDKSPPTSSFPSGHTAASVALYGGVAVLLIYIYGRNWKTSLAAVLLFCLPIIVGLSRLYRGMHYPTDVLAGALGGGLWMSLVISTLLPSKVRPEHRKNRAEALQ
ncbi:MAG TPA: phosphatase PAP2 family protein [Candidatus Nanopelagicaceae bacterium]